MVSCCPAGPTELTAYSDRHDEFAAMNAQVLGVSVDSQYAHLQWTRQPRNEGEQAIVRWYDTSTCAYLGGLVLGM
jgi:alkyl hydroperoxide reductase subunit AhpC